LHRCKSCDIKRRIKEGNFPLCQKGENHPFFGHHHTEESKQRLRESHIINGLSREQYSYEFMKLRISIRTRDNYTCQCCGLTEKENLQMYHRVLTVHHIDYNKEHCQENNLITTCAQCNSRANYNRSYWQNFYNNLILQKVG
jgi:5-methylcytosine-specific restriction endonuclease McrA